MMCSLDIKYSFTLSCLSIALSIYIFIVKIRLSVFYYLCSLLSDICLKRMLIILRPVFMLRRIISGIPMRYFFQNKSLHRKLPIVRSGLVGIYLSWIYYQVAPKTSLNEPSLYIAHDSFRVTLSQSSLLQQAQNIQANTVKRRPEFCDSPISLWIVDWFTFYPS